MRVTRSGEGYPDSKVHGANMGPIWGRQDPGGPHVSPMNFAIWVALLPKFSTSERRLTFHRCWNHFNFCCTFDAHWYRIHVYVFTRIYTHNHGIGWERLIGWLGEGDWLRDWLTDWLIESLIDWICSIFVAYCKIHCNWTRAMCLVLIYNPSFQVKGFP